MEFKAKASGKQKRSLFQRLLHWFRIAVLVFVGSSVAVVLLYRFVPPPATPLMLLRLGNQLEEGKKFRLEKNWKPLEKISPYMAASVIISEDQEFFEHHGFDFDAADNGVSFGRHVNTAGDELFPAQIRGSVQASFALVVGFVVSWAPTIPPLIAGNKLDHISIGFLFPMALTFAAAFIFAFLAPETSRKQLEDVVAR